MRSTVFANSSDGLASLVLAGLSGILDVSWERCLLRGRRLGNRLRLSGCELDAVGYVLEGKLAGSVQAVRVEKVDAILARLEDGRFTLPEDK